MMKVNQALWTTTDDLMLAETVLSNVLKGGTQANAFEEASDYLERTTAACAFRWHTFVKQQYTKEIIHAKKCRQSDLHLNLNRENLSLASIQASVRVQETNDLSIDTIILYLQKLRQEELVLMLLQDENERLKREIQELRSKNEKAEQQIELLLKQYLKQGEYEVLKYVMEVFKLAATEPDEHFDKQLDHQDYLTQVAR